MKEKTVYALGFFDGVHLGHQALLTACRSLAAETGSAAGVITFDTHPETLVAGHAPLLINSLADRKRLLSRLEIQTVVTMPFDDNLRQMPWQDFFQMLMTKYHASGIVCGDDFRFGYRGEGNASLLQAACLSAGIPCVVVPEQLVDGVRISSTHIRKLLEDGQTEEAVRFLGHPHLITGTVVAGRGIGKTLGVPTANLILPKELVQPKLGVYACTAVVDGRTYLAVTNIGTRPTVGGHHITVEPWLLDFEGDLYGRELTLALHKFLRPEKKFPSLEALQAEIRKNARQTRDFLEKT